jgi:hypothetical protein
LASNNTGVDAPELSELELATEEGLVADSDGVVVAATFLRFPAVDVDAVRFAEANERVPCFRLEDLFFPEDRMGAIVEKDEDGRSHETNQFPILYILIHTPIPTLMFQLLFLFL